MESFFLENELHILQIYDNIYDNLVKVFAMLYAYDTAIFTSDAQGLQPGLDCLYLYCNAWKLDVNVEKNKIVVLWKSKWKGEHIFKYDGHVTSVEDSFKYLGVILNYNGTFAKHRKHVIDRSLKTMFALLRRSKQLDLLIDLQLNYLTLWCCIFYYMDGKYGFEIHLNI